MSYTIAGFVNRAHDAGVAEINEEGEITFASSAERYVKKKHFEYLGATLYNKLLEADHRVFYEDTSYPDWPERTFVNLVHFDSMEKAGEGVSMETIKEWNTRHYYGMTAESCLDHHSSHAAASFYTRPWESPRDTVILSIDGAGKDTYTSNNIYVYDAENNKLVNKYSDYISVGQLYSAVTEYLGFGYFEEGTVMGLSCFGEPVYINHIRGLVDAVYDNTKDGRIAVNEGRMKAISEEFFNKNLPSGWKREDLAASIQFYAEERILHYAKMARQYGSRLCYSGGCAQNILANSKIRPMFKDVWMVSDPTDGGSCLGAAAWEYCNQFGGSRVKWVDAYLGHNIERNVDPKAVVEYLLKEKVCGIANGQAEFGPRALGNRSLIGDVRYDIKDTVNKIKRRESFRPFGPLILEEEFDKWFEGPTNGYMQYVCKPKHDLTSVIHVDGTSRVQTVPANSRSIIRPILEEYYEKTGVPMLMNTSLNIKGKPMVNDIGDAMKFESKYGVKVF